MANGPHDLAALGAAFPGLAGLRFIASGGQKAVYAATDPQHGEIALKILASGADAVRATREIHAVQNFHCVQVPRIYDTGIVHIGGADCIWFTETWLAGQTLRSILDAHAVTDQLTVAVAREMLIALQEAERNGVVHRDVKPENIVAEPVGLRCTLVDFGIARHLRHTSLTATALPWGACTPGYAPPEQFENLKAQIDGRADLFALGVTLYECVEGVNPYRNGTSDVGEMLRRVKAAPLPALSRDLDAQGNFKQLVLGMTRIRRNHRIRNVESAKRWFDSIRF